MASKKLEDLSVDDLMKIASKKLSKKTKVISRRLSHLDEIKQFILSEDIKSSNTPVPAVVIYDRYKRWCDLNHTKVRARNVFFKEFKNHFKSVKSGGMLRYLINPDGFDLTDSNIKRIQNEKKKS